MNMHIDTQKNPLSIPLSVQKAQDILHKLLQDENRDKKDKSVPLEVKKARADAIKYYDNLIQSLEY
jgi:hypothetical protein